MADISSYLKKILEAVYGEEVRGSIHDALAAMNVESSSAMQFASTAKDSAQASAALAKTSADTAVTKAEEIVVSANAAKLSETNARSAEENAVNKAAAAAASETAAKLSETNAANSEAVAIQKASEAEASKNAAAISEANALAAEQRTKDVKAEVETLGAKAEADKNAAEAARDAAKGSQDAAAESAALAVKSSGDAAAAKDAAQDAQLAAEAAQAAAEAAEAETEDARDTAVSAKDTAVASATDAEASAQTAMQYSGKPAIIDEDTRTWHIWNADTGEYEDTGLTCDLEGPQGVSVQDIQLTSGDHTPGTTDTYTLTLTDGSTFPLTVYNGRNGTGTGDVLGVGFDLVLPADGWEDGVINVYEPQLVASAKFKYLVAADDDSKDEYIDCGIQPKDVTTNGVITFTNKSDPTSDLTVNVLRFELGANGS